MAINNFIPTIWSEKLYRELDKNFVAVAHCNREFEGEIKEMGSRVKICGVGPVTISNYTKNTNMSAPEVLSDNARELIIDRAKYFNFQIDDIDRAQATPQLMDAALHNAAQALANEADKYVYSLYNQAAIIDEYDVDASNIYNCILNSRTQLIKNGVSGDDLILEVSPEISELLLLSSLLKSSDNTDAYEKGYIGMIAGCRVFVSNNIYLSYDEDHDCNYHHCLMRSNRAIAFAEQISEIEAYRPELRFADAMKGLHLYGAKVVYSKELADLAMNIVSAVEE